MKKYQVVSTFTSCGDEYINYEGEDYYDAVNEYSRDCLRIAPNETVELRIYDNECDYTIRWSKKGSK